MSEVSDKATVFLDKLIELGDQLVDAAGPAAEAAADAALTAIRFRGTLWLGAVAVAYVAALALAILAMSFWRHAAITNDPELEFPAVIVGGMAIMFAAGATVALLNPWVWMAALRPDAYLAASVLGL